MNNTTGEECVVIHDKDPYLSKQTIDTTPEGNHRQITPPISFTQNAVNFRTVLPQFPSDSLTRGYSSMAFSDLVWKQRWGRPLLSMVTWGLEAWDVDHRLIIHLTFTSKLVSSLRTSKRSLEAEIWASGVIWEQRRRKGQPGYRQGGEGGWRRFKHSNEQLLFKLTEFD